jgi:hypothetical protein
MVYVPEGAPAELEASQILMVALEGRVTRTVPGVPLHVGENAADPGDDPV